MEIMNKKGGVVIYVLIGIIIIILVVGVVVAGYLKYNEHKFTKSKTALNSEEVTLDEINRVNILVFKCVKDNGKSLNETFVSQIKGDCFTLVYKNENKEIIDRINFSDYDQLESLELKYSEKYNLSQEFESLYLYEESSTINEVD